MRKIQLYDSDATMYDKEIMPQDFEFFQKHKDAFKRMWHDQGKEFWVRFVMTFRSFSVKYGIIKEFQLKQENYEAIIDYAFIYIHEQYVDGKLGTARELVLDIVVTAQYRHLLQHLESKSLVKDPFYNKDTRDVFRRLFGQPGEKATHLKVLLILPLYLKYGGAVCQCLRRWLEAPSMNPNDDSYWVAPSKTKEVNSGDSIDYHFSAFIQERLNGNPLGPCFVVFWPFNLADPRKIDKNNPLYNLNDPSADWREKLTFDKYKAFVNYCESKYNSQTINKKKANKTSTSQEKETIAPPKPTSLAGKRKKNKKKKKKSTSGNGGDDEDIDKDEKVEAHYQFRVKIQEEKEEVTSISMQSTDRLHAASLLDISKRVLEKTVADITNILGDGGEDSDVDEEDNMCWYNASSHAMLNIHMANMLNDERERHAARNEKRNPKTEANGHPVTITERKHTFDQILKRPSGDPAPNTNILKVFRRPDVQPWKGIMSQKELSGKRYCPNPLHFELTMRYFGENRDISYCVCGQRTQKTYLDESERSANYDDLKYMQEYRLETVMARMKERGIWGKPRENIVRRETTTFHYEKDPAADSNKNEESPPPRNMEREERILSTLLGRGTPEQKMEMVKAQLRAEKKPSSPSGESGGGAEAAKPSGQDTDMLRVDPARGSNLWKDRMASVEVDGEYYCPNPSHYELTQRYFGTDSDGVKREITYCICGQKVRPDLIDENERLGDFKSLTAAQKAEFMAIQARGGRRAPLLNDDAIKAQSLRNAAKMRTAGSKEPEGDFTQEDAEALNSVFDDLGFDNDVKKSLFKALPATKGFRIDMKGNVVSVQSDNKCISEPAAPTPILDTSKYVAGKEYVIEYTNGKYVKAEWTGHDFININPISQEEGAAACPPDRTRECLLEAVTAHVKDLMGDLPAGLSPRVDQKKRTQAMKDRLRQKQMHRHMDMELDAQLSGFLDMEPPPPPSLPLPSHEPFYYPPPLAPSSPVKTKSVDYTVKQDKIQVKAADQMQNGSAGDEVKTDKQEHGTRIDPVHGSSVDPLPHSPVKDSNKSEDRKKSEEEKNIPKKKKVPTATLR